MRVRVNKADEDFKKNMYMFCLEPASRHVAHDDIRVLFW